MAKAVARRKKRKAARAGNSSRSGSGERPKAPRTEAQIAASRASIAKAREARAANREADAEQGERQSAPHPADSPSRPKAFFTVGRREKASKGADAGDATAQPGGAGKGEKPEPKALTLDEMRSFRDKLISMLVSLWELADKGLTATAFDGEEAFIWRSIDDNDTAFLADRILAKGRENPYIGAQVRAMIDHWSDLRMWAIVGPRLLESAGWHGAHGIRVSVAGVNFASPPKPKRGRAQSNGHYGQPGATTAYSTAQGATYGAQ